MNFRKIADEVNPSALYRNKFGFYILRLGEIFFYSQEFKYISFLDEGFDTIQVSDDLLVGVYEPNYHEYVVQFYYLKDGLWGKKTEMNVKYANRLSNITIDNSNVIFFSDNLFDIYKVEPDTVKKLEKRTGQRTTP